MWGHLSSLGQNVAQITKAVGAQLLDNATDDERLDADDFSDGDHAECDSQEPPAILVQKVQRLQDKLGRARDEIDRLNDIRARATESVVKSLKNKDEEIAELRQLLEETQLIVSECVSPHSLTDESTFNPESSIDAHIAAPVIHQKIKASERLSMLTRKIHEEKRNHIAAFHQLKSENAKLKDRVHALESQLAARDATSAELEEQLTNQKTFTSELQNQLIKQSEELETQKMVIDRLRSDSSSASDRSEIESLRKLVAEQASSIAQLECLPPESLQSSLAELRAELDRVRSASGSDDAHEELSRLQLQLESERTCLKSALQEADDLRKMSLTSQETINALKAEIAKLTSEIESSRDALVEMKATKSDIPSSSSLARPDLVPKKELIQLREKARVQLRQFAQKCKVLENENAKLRSVAQNDCESLIRNPDSEKLKHDFDSLQDFVKELRNMLALGTAEFPDFSLEMMKEAIAVRLKSPVPSSTYSDELELKDSLKELLQLEDVTPAVVTSKLRSVIHDYRTAVAQNQSLSLEFKQAQESIVALTATKATMKIEIESLMQKISELQAQCREAFAEEKLSSDQNRHLKQQIESLQTKLSEATRQKDQKHSSSISRINVLEKEVHILQKEMDNKNAVILELTTQLENKTKRLVEIEKIQETWLEQAQRDRDTLIKESARLRQDLTNLSEDYETRISALQDQIRKERELGHQTQLDLQASQDLAADFAALQDQLRTKEEQCASLSDALENLQVVLDQFNAERDLKLSEAEARLKASLDAAEEGRLAVQELMQVTQSLKESEANIVQLETKLIMSRKYALQVESDNAALRHAMHQTMDKIKSFSSDENLVDKRIVNKLLVTYLERKASADVLNLMVKMLGFTEEQRRLVYDSQRPRGIMSSLSSFIPTPYSVEDDDILDDGLSEQIAQQENLADLWVNFLLKETGSGSRRHSIASVHSNDPDPESLKSPSSLRTTSSVRDVPRRNLGDLERSRSSNQALNSERSPAPSQ